MSTRTSRSDAARARAEVERLAALERYGVLDTPPEQGFDDIVLLARQVCAAPIALVGLVDADRQWFKARTGFGPSEIPLDQSLCALGLSPADILVIPDLERDARTRDNPLVTGTQALRFYAGAPLVTPEGNVMGTVCVLDTTPRPHGLTQAQSAALSALARQTMALFELRRTVSAHDAGLGSQHRESDGLRLDAAGLSERELRLRLAVEAAGVGIFDYDLVRETLIWDMRTREMFGIGPDDPITYESAFLAGVHPEDRERTDRAVREALDPARANRFDCEYRTIDREGRLLRWVAARGQLVMEDATPVRFVGTVRDITADRSAQDAIHASRERYRLVTRATNDAIWDWDLVADHVLWNEALCTAYGWEPQQVEPTGAWWLSQVHPDDRGSVEDDIGTAIAGSDSDWSHEYRFRRADGRYADVLDRGSIVRGPDGAPLRMIGAMLDLTERNRAEAQLRAVFEGANVGIVQLDPRTLVALRVNAKLCAIWGACEDEIVGHSVSRWTPDEDAEARDVLHRRLVAGEIMRETLEKRYRRKDGRLIWARVNLVAQLRAGEMQTTAMIEDITAEKFEEASQASLIVLADRLQQAASLDAAGSAAADSLGLTLGAAHAGYATIDTSTKRVRIAQGWPTDAATILATSVPIDALTETLSRLRGGDALVVPDVETDPALGREAASTFGVPTRAVIAIPVIRQEELVGWLFGGDRAARDWMPREVDFARAVVERILTALVRIEAEEQQRILNRELSHRLKNTLSMVQAIVSQTLRNVAGIDNAKEVLEARLIALGKAHDVLLEGESESADIAAVIGGALAIHDDNEPGRFRLSGPPILVGPTAALALTLMVHELATNAVKYGALSVPSGHVVVGWSVEPVDGVPSLELRWTEQGGPAAVAPSYKGFGSRLIERGFSGAVGGGTAVDYAPGGLVCRISAPLSGLLARE